MVKYLDCNIKYVELHIYIQWTALRTKQGELLGEHYDFRRIRPRYPHIEKLNISLVGFPLKLAFLDTSELEELKFCSTLAVI